MTPKETAIAIIKASFGDNLERAEFAFRNFTLGEMQQQYGESGQTRQKILDGYRKDREARITAFKWAESA